MKTIKLFAFMALVCVLLTSSAYAGVITQTFTLLPSSTEIAAGTSTGTFNFFASAGAPVGSTLTSVTLEMLITDTITALSVKNNDTTTQNFNITSSSNITVGGTAPAADLTDRKSGV